jgi:hypothetical protein
MEFLRIQGTIMRGDAQHFGNLMVKKADYVCRLAFLNVDTFPDLASDTKNWIARATFKKVAD